MLWWRKRPPAFEWHQYVRTTIKLKREDRRRRVADLREAAVGRVRAVGEGGAEAGRHGLLRLRRGVVAGMRGAGSGARSGMRWASAKLAPAASRVAGPLSEPGIASLLLLFAALGMGAALYLLLAQRFTSAEVYGLLAGSTVFAALALVGERQRAAAGGPAGIASSEESSQRGIRRLARIPVAVWGAGLMALVGVVTLGALGAPGVMGAAGRGLSGLAGGLSMPGLLSRSDDARTLEGTAVAIDGQSLRIGGRAVRLAGIEAPLPEQTCVGSPATRRWQCGASAREALAKAVRAKRVRCELDSAQASVTGSRATEIGRCRAGEVDLASTMVAQGHVFAEEGWFASYTREQAEAMTAKLGVWLGKSERPAAYRSRVWEEARRQAAGGCPIKGVGSGEARVFTRPWDPGYQRVQMRPKRGDRWFCSEAEAIEAGYRPAKP